MGRAGGWGPGLRGVCQGSVLLPPALTSWAKHGQAQLSPSLPFPGWGWPQGGSAHGPSAPNFRLSPDLRPQFPVPHWSRTASENLFSPDSTRLWRPRPRGVKVPQGWTARSVGAEEGPLWLTACVSRSARHLDTRCDCSSAPHPAGAAGGPGPGRSGRARVRRSGRPGRGPEGAVWLAVGPVPEPPGSDPGGPGPLALGRFEFRSRPRTHIWLFSTNLTIFPSETGTEMPVAVSCSKVPGAAEGAFLPSPAPPSVHPGRY